MIAVFKQTFRSYFLTPMGYLYMGFFLLVTGIYFVFINLMPGNARFSSFLGSILLLYLFAIPMLTMRLFSEERRQKTDQLLLTAPVTIGEIVVGKFLGAFALFLLTLCVTVTYAAVIGIFGELWIPETAGAYIGFIFLGAAYIAVGLFISASTENQITAGLVSFFGLFMLWLIDPISRIFPTDIKSGVIAAGVLTGLLCVFLYLNTKSVFIAIIAFGVCAAGIAALFFLKPLVFNGFIRKVFSWFSLNQRYQDFAMGVVKIETLFYYASFCGVFLFLTLQVIEKRRWV